MRVFPTTSSTRKSCLAATFASLLGIRTVTGIALDLTNPQSIKNAAATTAAGLMAWYNGNQPGQIPGNLPQPYYWWEAGAMFMSMIDYWFYTGDNQYNDLITQAILWQVGPNNDFMTPNQTKTEGNDDQVFWAFAAMDAAELKFPNPPATSPQWLALAQAVFNLQAGRWDNSTCGGGLRWQIFPFNAGYNYKNGISNGGFFSLGARLARYTNNQTYADWAEKMWDWTVSINLQSPQYQYYDGSDDTINCTQINHIQWTYTAAVFLHGAASMYNYTESQVWKDRVDGIIAGLDVFFPGNASIMSEVACEQNGKCNNDQRSFKAYLSRWMAATTQLCPWTYDTIMTKLRASATAAAEQCSGGVNGTTCGLRWTLGSKYDGMYGPGEQMAAMAVIGANLIDRVVPPVTNSTGGISQGNPAAGTSSNANPIITNEDVMTTGDKVGAGFLTTFILMSILGGAWWMVA